MSSIRILCGGSQLTLSPGQTAIIGRGRDCDVVLTDSNTSRRHLQVTNKAGQALLRDLGSSNGTWVDGSRIVAPTVLRPGQQALVGGRAGEPLHVQAIAPPPRATPPPQPRMHSTRLPDGGATHTAPLSNPATASVPRVPNHTGVVFDRFSLPSGPMQQRTPISDDGGTMLSGSHPQLMPDRPAGRSAIMIGRGLDNQIVVEDLLVSRHHARLTPTGPSSYDVEDLDSRNGTYVNGQRVIRGNLTEGDLLAVGHSRFTVRAGQLVASVDEGDVNFVANHLTFTLPGGKKLLDDISFALEGSSLLGVVGPSGAGKSTLLKALTGAQQATEGEVYYDGRDLYQNFDDLRHRIGVVPQDDVVHRQLTVRQALRFAAELRFPDDLDKHLRDQRVDEVMAELDLTEHAGTRVDKLSGGQRKRTSVALELLTRPSLLFLDEPTSGLDPGLDKQVMNTLRGLADGGRTVVVITHSVANLGVCDKVLLLAPGGKVAYLGPPDQLLSFFGLSDHADVFTQVARDAEGSKHRFETSPLGAQEIAGPLRAARRPVGPAQQETVHRQQSIPSQLSTLVRRHTRVILADRGYAAFMFVLPVALALLAIIMPGDSGLALPVVKPGTATQMAAKSLLLVLIVGAIFMGTAASIRELVGERAIYAREKSVGLSPTAYLSGKLAVFGVLAFIQSVILVLLTLAVRKSATSALVFGSPSLELIVVCWVTAFCAVSLGLLMSSFVTTSEQVMPLLVITVMAQMVLSGGLFDLDGTVKSVAMAVPSRWNFAAGASSIDLNRITHILNPTAKTTDTLWKHNSGTFLLDLGVAIGFLVVFALVTRWRLGRTKD